MKNSIHCDYCNKQIELAALPILNHYIDLHPDTGLTALQMTKRTIKNIKKIDRAIAKDLNSDLSYLTLLLNLEK